MFINEYFYLKKRLKSIKEDIELADWCKTRVQEDPEIHKYIDFKNTVVNFKENYNIASIGDGIVRNYDSLKKEYNHGIYKNLFKRLDRKLKKEGISIEELTNFKIPEFEDRLLIDFLGRPVYRSKDEWKTESKGFFSITKRIKEDTELRLEDIRRENASNEKETLNEPEKTNEKEDLKVKNKEHLEADTKEREL